MLLDKCSPAPASARQKLPSPPLCRLNSRIISAARICRVAAAISITQGRVWPGCFASGFCSIWLASASSEALCGLKYEGSWGCLCHFHWCGGAISVGVKKWRTFQCRSMICQNIPRSRRWTKIPITSEGDVHNQLAPSDTNGMFGVYV